jgi:hypothetical protein
MHSAIGASWLRLAEDAPLQAPASVIVQINAFGAKQTILWPVMAAAVHPQHGGDHPEFARAPRGVHAARRDAVRPGHDRPPLIATALMVHTFTFGEASDRARRAKPVDVSNPMTASILALKIPKSGS